MNVAGPRGSGRFSCRSHASCASITADSARCCATTASSSSCSARATFPDANRRRVDEARRFTLRLGGVVGAQTLRVRIHLCVPFLTERIQHECCWPAGLRALFLPIARKLCLNHSRLGALLCHDRLFKLLFSSCDVSRCQSTTG
mmetsp:Transcript_17949/g.53648  ORF Transcript_17949/g.53648 Transcript_17949/m.53648 type:complete len:144 (+) Transcript_17949:100-531(+)